MPLRSTNRMPVRTARSGIGFRPAYCRRRDRRFGSNGSIRVHNASSSKGSVMPDHLPLGQGDRTKPQLGVQEAGWLILKRTLKGCATRDKKEKRSSRETRSG
jgi:hypothetical protein